MIEENQFCNSVVHYFNFLTTEFGFELLGKEIRGNVFYDIQFSDKNKIVSISYENIEDYLLVVVSILQNGKLPDFDDKTKRLHLNKISSILFSKIGKDEIHRNNEFFLNFCTSNELDRKLIKSAKELRLCLIHFSEIQKN